MTPEEERQTSVHHSITGHVIHSSGGAIVKGCSMCDSHLAQVRSERQRRADEIERDKPIRDLLERVKGWQR